MAPVRWQRQKLLAITQDADNSEWDHRSLQLLMEEVGPQVADLGRA